MAYDLPNGWKALVDDFIRYFRPRIDEYRKMVAKNSIFQGRTKGVGIYTTDSAIEKGISGRTILVAATPQSG